MLHTCFVERQFVYVVFLSQMFLTELFNSQVIFGKFSVRKQIQCLSFLSFTIHRLIVKIKIVNRSLEVLLRCLVSDHLTMWDIILHIAKFAYNSLASISIQLSPFKIVTSYTPRKHITLFPFPQLIDLASQPNHLHYI